MSVQEYFDNINLMDIKIKSMIEKEEAIKLFQTISDVGSLKIGGGNFSVLIPNGYGDGLMHVYITSGVKISEEDGFRYFTLVEGSVKIYQYDCGDEVIFTMEGRFEAWYGNGNVILNEIKG